MEDEIASMAAILGASWGGMKSMTATSGPGFSLMMENIGLGMMTETPCVVVNIQRGGPSTGLPTLVGQADVMQARWGAHGDYGCIALAPDSPQECFDLTVEAFNLSEIYRQPVFLMADEVVGHMTEKVIIPRREDLKIVSRPKPRPQRWDYLPFDSSGPLPAPMAAAGQTGLTHDERGYPDMSGEAHHALVTRLNEKIDRHVEEITRLEDYGLEDARIVVVSFGCTARSARRAVREARARGIPVGLLRLISLWPFPEAVLRDLAQRVDTFIVAEMNLGQVRLEVERCSGRPAVGVHHAGGEMIHPEQILQAILRSAGR